MQKTDVEEIRVYLREGRGPKADVSIRFTNGLIVNKVAIWTRKDGSGDFITFPSEKYTDADGNQKTKNFVYFPERTDRDLMEEMVLEEYAGSAKKETKRTRAKKPESGPFED